MGGRPSKYPGDEIACATVIRVGEQGGGKDAMACALQVSKQTMLRWMDVECDQYQSQAFCDAVEEGLTRGRRAFIEHVQEHMVEEPGGQRINAGVMKFVAQHKYGLVERTQVEQQQSGSITMHVSEEESEL
jgi:hypothetical protein